MPTTCGSVAKSLSTTPCALTLLTVLPAASPSISVRVGASVTTGDAPYRSVIVRLFFFQSSPLLDCLPMSQPANHALCRLVSWPAPLQGNRHHPLSRQNRAELIASCASTSVFSSALTFALPCLSPSVSASMFC